MKKIESYQQLKEEKMLCKLRINDLELRIKDNFAEIKNDLKPWNLAGKTLRNMLKSEDHGIVGESVGMTVNMLVKNILFRKRNFVTKAIISFVAKNYANSLITKNAENILDGMQTLLSKLKRKPNQKRKHFDESTVDIDLEA